jgi:hypothetical protein
MRYEIINNITQDQEKEKYCPRCYFDDDLWVLRTKCKHSNVESPHKLEEGR